ncbi:MAG TPA: TraR/DksA family transcriptional regulator [Candidatus Bathyarchaeia archaeon]|nr:TraR/DksA family transcriptional regulator [Candidatus Bathyarchaeia archaeon]
MSKRNLEVVRQNLLKRKRELEEQLTAMTHEKFSDGQVQDPGDQTLSSTMESLRVSLQDAELGEYNRLVRALQKIDDQTYGICMDCGNEISEKRLKSYPDAMRCLICQEEYEDTLASGQ